MGAVKSAQNINDENTQDSDYTIINEPKFPKVSTKDARTIAFALKYPIAATAIGEVVSGKGVTNISTNAARFSNNYLGLDDDENISEGGQVNAFRHVLWQATITKQFGSLIAFEAGNAHEENPSALNGIKDLNKVRFTTLRLADEAIDILNNTIGRQIGQSVSNSNMKDISFAILDYYHETGLRIAVKQDDGTYAIIQEKLSDDQYKTALERLNVLDSNGFAPEDQ